MYNHQLHQQINSILTEEKIRIAGPDNLFYTRCIANAAAIHALFYEVYGSRTDANEYFEKLVRLLAYAHNQRPAILRDRDDDKQQLGSWFLSNELTGMSLYVDRFCGTLPKLNEKLDYFNELGINLLHLMPLFESPPGESDGGYAISDFRKIDKRYGTLKDLQALQQNLLQQDMYLMLDIVLNHTSHKHPWAEKAKAGDRHYQQYYYMFDDRAIPDQFEKTMPEIFPASAPGNFTYDEGSGKWVMTVFHNYQWDLNYTNPMVMLEMMDTIFFYANLGVDILRIDAPAFIWKQLGTTCQNLPQAHALLRLIKQCVHVATPGMALLGEAIVSPSEIMKYFGTGLFIARECDLAYNATHMALQWDALATGDTAVMLAAQHEILQKPFGTTWITYTRCHDDIGLGYEDYMIEQAGYDPYKHRQFLKNYYTGEDNSPATGALFSSNPKTGDARISGSLASLCGLEKSITDQDENAIEIAIRKISLMQAHSFFIGGIPMLFYGDECGYTNDYTYLKDSGKSYDNRWMHRPLIDWNKNERRKIAGTTEQKVFSATQRLINLRKQLIAVADHKNLAWLVTNSRHVAGYLRSYEEQKLYCLFNFSAERRELKWNIFKGHGAMPVLMYDHWDGKDYVVGGDNEIFHLDAYKFLILEVR